MSKSLITIFVMAIVTYIPRVLPITLFRRKIHSSFIRSFLSYVPFAVLGALTFPDILYSTNHLSSALAGMFVALLLSYFEKGLMTVALSAIFTVYLVELFVSL